MLQVAGGTVPLLLKGRYRFLQSKNWTSALTAHLGVQLKNNIVALTFIVNSNTTYYPNSNWNFNFHVGTLGLAGFVGGAGAQSASQETLAVVELGVSGTYIVREQTSFQADFVYSPLVHATADTAAGSSSLSLTSLEGAPLFAMARLQLLYRSTPTSLWSFGGGVLTLGKAVSYFPTLSWTKIL